MAESNGENTKRVWGLFAKDRQIERPNDERVGRIMQRVHHEAGMKHIGLLIFVRFWLVLLQMGAELYVQAAKKNHSHVARPHNK